jgi:hypothetical protein
MSEPGEITMVCGAHDIAMQRLATAFGRERFICLACEREEADAMEASFVGARASKRATAWARSAIGTPYGATEAVPAAPRSGTAPDPPDQSIPRLRGGDACG